MDLLFGFSGRIGRGFWWLGQLAIVVMWVALIFALGSVINISGASPTDAAGELSNSGIGVVAFVLASIVLLVWVNLAVTVKRLHDRNKSGAWFCIVFVPIIGPIWQIVECGFLAGTPGGNDYGSGGGGTAGFSSELEAHIAQMKAVRATTMSPVAAAPSQRVSTPVTAPRRAPASSGFGKRGL